MNILKKLTNKSLKLNKKRTIGTIIGIILSTAMICAVATMVTSFRKTLIEETIDNHGYYHLILENVDNKVLDVVKNNRDFSYARPFYSLGYTELDTENYGNMYLQIISASKDNLEALKYTPYEGRYPENSSEIMLTGMAMDFFDIKIGDTITFDVGKLVVQDGVINSEDEKQDMDDVESPPEGSLTDLTKKTYKVVGSTSVVYTFRGFTTGETSDDMEIYMTLAKPSTYKKSISEVLGVSDWNKFYNGLEDTKYDYTLNTYLLHLEVFTFSEETTAMLLAIAGIVIGIIMIASVFCIRNSFAISTVEKMKMYGMLASVGATKKQIRKSVIYEGLILGAIGIPIGILSGLLGDFILFKVVNSLLSDFINTSEGIIFTPSIIAAIIAVLLAFLTIFLSSLSSARKASKVSPIENLRSSKEVMVKSKKLKTPKFVEKMFKTGGVLAYKNLKRSKKKYRTTVISLTVSIFVFISLSYFVSAGFDMTSDHYKDLDYNISIYGGTYRLKDEDAKVLTSLDHVKNSYVMYNTADYYVNYDLDSLRYKDPDVFSYRCEGNDDGTQDCEEYVSFEVAVVDNNTFKDYAKKIGANYDIIKDKAILYDTFYYYKDGETTLTRKYTYEKNDKLVLKDYNTGENHEFLIGAIASEQVIGYEYVDMVTLVVNKDYFKGEVYLNSILLDSDDADATEKDIENYNDKLIVNNEEKEARAMRSMIIVISIFLYGFITLITLIGVTNIFNTITSNMELRSKEFAMLKSIGMTKKEFNRMITLETIFYSSKSLVYGTVLGLIGCLLLRKAFDKDVIREFVPPYGAILICVIFVFVIVFIIMKYSIMKINKKNTIETIRNENV